MKTVFYPYSKINSDPHCRVNKKLDYLDLCQSCKIMPDDVLMSRVVEASTRLTNGRKFTHPCEVWYYIDRVYRGVAINEICKELNITDKQYIATLNHMSRVQLVFTPETNYMPIQDVISIEDGKIMSHGIFGNNEEQLNNFYTLAKETGYLDID